MFSLIGLQLPTLIRHLSGADQPWLLAAVAIAATLMLVRIAWIFPLGLVQQWRAATGSRRQLWWVAAVASWAGARGVVPLAAALSIPLVDANGAPVPQRDLLLVLATTVIAISLVVQGFTLAPLVRFAGVAVPARDARDEYARHEDGAISKATRRAIERQLDFEEARISDDR